MHGADWRRDEHHASYPGANNGTCLVIGPVPQASVQEVATRLARGDELLVIDVREPWELQRASIPNAISIPLGEIPELSATLDREKEYVVMCHHGVRSEVAAEWLLNHGFSRVSNLDGGIDAWSTRVDKSIPRY
jgi:adenylyltransferase/sulfurtransferase